MVYLKKNKENKIILSKILNFDYKFYGQFFRDGINNLDLYSINSLKILENMVFLKSPKIFRNIECVITKKKIFWFVLSWVEFIPG